MKTISTGRFKRHCLKVLGEMSLGHEPILITKKGKPMNETGSVLTITLQKGAAGWRITGWAWAQH